MSPENQLPAPAWQVGRSISMEMDVVLSGIDNPTWTPIFHQEFGELGANSGQDWLADWRQAFGKSRNMVSFLEMLAFLSGKLIEEDYQATMLSLRSLGLQDIRDALEWHARHAGVMVDSDRGTVEQVVELGVKLYGGLYAGLGLKFTNLAAHEKETRWNMTCLTRVIREGDLHDWFWMWLDRFYFQIYQSWRESHLVVMDHNETHAIMSLGAPAGPESPRTTWLPEQNVLMREPVYLDAIRAGKLCLFFWVEPFGLADMWSLNPGLLAVTFSEPGEMYQRFIERAQNLARRTQALADPTRLGILRIIRHFGMINTDIGKFMGVSRPTVSIHAKILREAGLIRSHEEGREMKHEIVPGELRRLFRDLQDFLDLPDEDRME